MEHEVRFLESALDDFEDIVSYIAKDSKSAALKMHDTIVEKAHDLSLFPKRGQRVPYPKIGDMGFRMLNVKPYILFYKIDNDVVYIHRVIHGAMNYPLLFE